MNRVRSIHLNFYVSEAEKKKIEEKMSEAEIESFSLFARLMLMGGQIVKMNFDEIKKLRYEVNRVGVNINQIVKLANENQQVSRDDIMQLLNLQRDIELKMNRLIKEVVKENDDGRDESISD